MTKTTKKEKFARLLTLSQVQADPELVELCEREIELLNRKNTNKKKTSAQIEMEGYKNSVMENVKPKSPFTVSQAIKFIPALNGISNQRGSSIMNGLVKDGLLTKETVKGVTYFCLAAGIPSAEQFAEEEDA